MAMGMMMAQQRVLETQAEKNKAEAEKISGVDTTESQARTASISQGVENAKVLQGLQKVETTLKELELFEQKTTQGNRFKQIEYTTERAFQELQ